MMKAGLFSAVLYALLAQGANAEGPDVSALLTGPLERVVLSDPKPLPDVAPVTLDGAPAPLGDYKGQWIVLNFWAAWCPPCREEMPSLDRLQAARPDIAVIPVAAGPNPRPAIDDFWADAAITNLTTLADPDMALAAQMGVMGLPVTVIVNPNGEEVARLIGSLAWDAPETLALLDALAAQP